MEIPAVLSIENIVSIVNDGDEVVLDLSLIHIYVRLQDKPKGRYVYDSDHKYLIDRTGASIAIISNGYKNVNQTPESNVDVYKRQISQIAQQWKCTICIGTGNEGNSGKHKQGKLIKEEQKILLDIAPFEQNLNLQIWKMCIRDRW